MTTTTTRWRTMNKSRTRFLAAQSSSRWQRHSLCEYTESPMCIVGIVDLVGIPDTDMFRSEGRNREGVQSLTHVSTHVSVDQSFDQSFDWPAIQSGYHGIFVRSIIFRLISVALPANDFPLCYIAPLRSTQWMSFYTCALSGRVVRSHTLFLECCASIASLLVPSCRQGTRSCQRRFLKVRQGPYHQHKDLAHRNIINNNNNSSSSSSNIRNTTEKCSRLYVWLSILVYCCYTLLEVNKVDIHSSSHVT